MSLRDRSKTAGSNGIFRESISDEELKGLPIRKFDGDIHLIDTIDKFEKIIPLLAGDTLLGFDTETKPSFRKGRRNSVSLLQLATDDTAFLMRLNLIGLPASLSTLLSDDSVIKAGVALRDDIKELAELSPFDPGGFTDLQLIADHFGIKNYSLKKMAAIVLGYTVSKRQQVSDWNARRLTAQQILYAATDAWVCYNIYRKLQCADNNIYLKGVV